MSSNSQSNGGIGFFSLLAIAFIVLKLTGYITWSWWWVTVPIWGSILFFIVVVLIVYFLIRKNP